MKLNFKLSISWILSLYIVLIPVIVVPITFKIQLLEYWFVDYFILPKVISLFAITILVLLVINTDKTNNYGLSLNNSDEVLLIIYLLVLILSTMFSVDLY